MQDEEDLRLILSTAVSASASSTVTSTRGNTSLLTLFRIQMGSNTKLSRMVERLFLDRTAL